MATTTTIGPIGARQINHNLYVGQSDLTTIQKAVNAGVAIGNCVVIIPAGYAGSDAIASVTGGSPDVYVADRRNTSPQNYMWNGANYVPADFNQAADVSATNGQFSGSVSISNQGTASSAPLFSVQPNLAVGASTSLYVGQSDTPGSSVYLAFLNGGSEVANRGQIGFYGGTFSTFDEDGDWDIPGDIQATSLGLSNQGTASSAPLFSVQPNLAVGASTSLYVGQSDTPGSSVYLAFLNGGSEVANRGQIGFYGGTFSTFDEDGDWDIPGDIAVNGDATIEGNINAESADFTTCEVDNSPVRTFANTPDGPGQGMVWPTSGIPVSLGDHWQSPSINPATLATYPAAGIPVSTGTAWSTPINPATLATYPAAGIPVSTGTAWGTPIAPATLPRLNTDNVFTGAISASGNLSTGGIFSTTHGASGLVPGTGRNQGLVIDWNVPAGQAKTVFINYNAGVVGGGFNWYNVAPGTDVNNGTLPLMDINVFGLFHTGGAISGQTITAPPNGGLSTGWNFTGGSGETDFINSSGGATAAGGFWWYNGAGGATINPAAPLMFLDSTGSLHVTGSITATTKSFRITHPQYPSKNLMHACLEGPEHGIFYRGEGITEGGWAEITLPDYFEALTMPTDRSVLLTALFEDEAEQVGMVAASRVKDGKFKVWSALPEQKFYWEVKAVRRDIEPLEVEPLRAEPQGMPEPTPKEKKK
jgi:hypothetical protein